VEVLNTEHFSLREMNDGDLDDLAALLGDEDVMRYYPRPKTRDEAQGWINWNIDLYRKHGFGLWVMTLTDSGEFVGECGLTIQTVDGIDEVEVGYHVLPRHQHRGYASEAAAGCRDLARERFSVSRLIAIINPANHPSQAVAEKIGLRFERQAQVYGLDQLSYAAQL
jgi:RimJ/RimL family protein N-acetyltransferase